MGPGVRSRPYPGRVTLTIYVYACPYCDAGDMGESVGRCLVCIGAGRVTRDQVKGLPESELVRLPVPPGVRNKACGGCAYRKGSPELEGNGATLPEDSPFVCHRGMGKGYGGQYVPAGSVDVGGKSLPIGGLICAGWWAFMTGGPLPQGDWVDDADRP